MANGATTAPAAAPVIGGWRTLSRFFFLTTARSWMIPLQYVNAE